MKGEKFQNKRHQNQVKRFTDERQEDTVKSFFDIFDVPMLKHVLETTSKRLRKRKCIEELEVGSSLKAYRVKYVGELSRKRKERTNTK